MNDINKKKRTRIGNSNTGSENIQSGHWDRIWHRDMRHANYEKRETTHDGKNKTTLSRKNRNAQRKEHLQILGNIGSGHHQTRGDERKNWKGVSQENEKATWNRTIE